MQKIFIEKQYRFVPPLKMDWLPKLMNNRLIHKPLLWFTESIASVETRGTELLRQSVSDGDAVMMIPNHPRTSDPVVLYDLIRKANTPMFAMASWHLFNRSWFEAAVIRMYGGYSVNREGLDRESINFSVSAMQDNRRPLLLFPEGATSRTNDAIMPYLDGATFIARSAARRRSKRGLKTVIHPVAIRYVFEGDFESELDGLLAFPLFHDIKDTKLDPAARVRFALNRLTELKEKQFGIASDPELAPCDRRQRLAESVLREAETRCFDKLSQASITNRIRDIRSTVFPELLNATDFTEEEKQIRWRDLERTYLAWQMASYPKDYLKDNSTVEAVLDIAAKINEDLTDQPRRSGKQRVIVEVCEPIEVPAAKFRGTDSDPLVEQIQSSILAKLKTLQSECTSL